MLSGRGGRLAAPLDQVAQSTADLVYKKVRKPCDDVHTVFLNILRVTFGHCLRIHGMLLRRCRGNFHRGISSFHTV